MARPSGLCGALALTLLCACSARPAYHLTSVLPAPVTPGAEVTVYGDLPEAAALRLDDRPLAALRVNGGWRVTLPEAITAGDHRLSLDGDGATLEGLVSVNPRLDGVTLEGQRLIVRGAGWDAAGLGAVRVSVDGRLLNPTANGAALAVAAPANLAYGALTVTVTVGDRLSDPFTLNRAAGAVVGHVRLPGAGVETVALRSQVATAGEVNRLHLAVVHAAHALDAVSLVGLESREALLPTLSLLRFRDEASAAAAEGRLRITPGVSDVRFEALVRGAQSACARADPKLGAGQWHLDLEGVRDAWARTRGEGVTVAVVDTGVAADHPAWGNRLLPGYDFIDGDTVPEDVYGHGTHVAGLIGADGAVSGVAPGVQLLPVRVLKDQAPSSESGVASGILWAAGLHPSLPNPHPAQVINLSLGSRDYPVLIAAAIGRALEAGVIVVAAAGNDGGALNYPAALPGVIAVTALAGPKTSYQPGYASRGAGLWLTAYGGDLAQDQNGDGVRDGLLSTYPADAGGAAGYALCAGTSMAAPQVSGLAALALASGTPPRLVADTLAATAADLGVMGFDARFGFGLVQARVATGAAPRRYVIARAGARIVSFALVQRDESFSLQNLPPDEPLTLIAASDSDGDGSLGEAGESISVPQPFTPHSGQTTTLPDLRLEPSDGSGSFPLEVHR